MDAIMQKDLYATIGVQPTASVPEIKKAYRKKSLKCHPDKNPDNPKAAEQFQELSRILEILTDANTRAAYDKVIAAKKQAKERIKEFDAKRKKFKEDLEAREEAYKRSLDPTSNENRLKAEIERLQKEGAKLLEEERASMQKQIWEKLHGLSKHPESKVEEFRIKIRWKAQKDDSTNGGYNYDNLHKIFSKYGDVAALVVSSAKKGRAMVEFGNKSAAELALLVEIGLAGNPLRLCGLWDTQKCSTNVASSASINIGRPMYPANVPLNSKPSASLSFPSAPDIFRQLPRMEYENSVLANLRRTEERKRLIEELKAQEED